MTAFFVLTREPPRNDMKPLKMLFVRFIQSTMNEDALSYRLNRGIVDKDEQMAILIQRVSGDYYGYKLFSLILQESGNSSNLYVWDKDIDMNAGMLRLVFGLGTRAVDRVIG